ncbi:MAG TPA: hypothetical protein VJC07_04440 [Candidatus Nanoarchaeia archaeon]|nr:hypothetical protein [Candidatus Nanoarchaeia archaeon]
MPNIWLFFFLKILAPLFISEIENKAVEIDFFLCAMVEKEASHHLIYIVRLD